MKEFKNEIYNGERCLFMTDNALIDNCNFNDGESPLKESSNLQLLHTTFNWKYPLWYCKNITMKECTMTATARAGIWYTDHFVMEDCVAECEKTFRRMNDVTVKNTDIPHALETFWYCNDVKIDHMHIVGDYVFLNCNDLVIDHLVLDGNYSFDGCKNVVVRNSILNSKDAFWNCENVLVENCKIIGEYTAWNSKNVTFVNCDIDSLQGLCYIEDLKMINCSLENTDRCFEYCKNIDANINSSIISIVNPISGKIVCKNVGQLIQDDPNIDTSKISIIEE